MAGRKNRRTNADRSNRRSGRGGRDSVRKNRESVQSEAEWEDDDDEDIFREGDFDTPFSGRSSRDSSRASRKAEKERKAAPADEEYSEEAAYSDGYDAGYPYEYGDGAAEGYPADHASGYPSDYSADYSSEYDQGAAGGYPEDRAGNIADRYPDDDLDDLDDLDDIFSETRPEDDLNDASDIRETRGRGIPSSEGEDPDEEATGGKGYGSRRGRSEKRSRRKSRERSRNSREDNVIRIGGDEALRQENEQRLSRRKAGRARLFILILVLLVVGGAAWYVYTNIREFKGYKVITSKESFYEVNADYVEFGGNLLKYTPEGISYINANGDVVWTAGADLKVPIADTRGNWAVVADKGGNSVHVFSTEGEVSKLTMPYKVLDIAVASQGAFSVVLESDTTNYVNMYDKTGNPIYEMQTSIDKSGYPLDISISDDGQKLFTSYFFMEGIETRNNLTAYNFGAVGQNANADRMVGGFSLDGELVAKVQFLTNNLIAAFSDSQIHLYDMKETPSERCVIRYQQNQIQSIFYSEKYIGTIERPTDASENSSYVMRVYDLNGDEMFHYAFNMAYETIHAGAEEIILTGGNQCMIITRKGRAKFRYAFDSPIRNMIPTASSNEYIVTFEGKTEKIRLKMEDE